MLRVVVPGAPPEEWARFRVKLPELVRRPVCCWGGAIGGEGRRVLVAVLTTVGLVVLGLTRRLLELLLLIARFEVLLLKVVVKLLVGGGLGATGMGSVALLGVVPVPVVVVEVLVTVFPLALVLVLEAFFLSLLLTVLGVGVFSLFRLLV